MTGAEQPDEGRRAAIGDARDSTHLVGDQAALRLEMAANGYLLLRNLVPAREIDAVRDALIGVLSKAGLTVGEDPVRAGLNVDVAADRGLFRQLYTQEVVHRLPHHPRLVGLAAALLGGDAPAGPLLVHPKPAVRVVFPDTPAPIGATAAHQDHLGMQGTTDVYTLWVALTPCSRETGVLAVVPGSHGEGVRPFHVVPGSRVAGCDASAFEDRWVTADLAPGDAFAFHSLTVHKSLPNRSTALRLSIDARYQRASDPVCEMTLREFPDIPWNELHAGWSAAPDVPHRDWRNLPLKLVPFDPRLLSAPRRTET